MGNWLDPSRASPKSPVGYRSELSSWGDKRGEYLSLVLGSISQGLPKEGLQSSTSGFAHMSQWPQNMAAWGDLISGLHPWFAPFFSLWVYPKSRDRGTFTHARGHSAHTSKLHLTLPHKQLLLSHLEVQGHAHWHTSQEDRPGKRPQQALEPVHSLLGREFGRPGHPEHRLGQGAGFWVGMSPWSWAVVGKWSKWVL